jgi:hypothetical protein
MPRRSTRWIWPPLQTFINLTWHSHAEPRKKHLSSLRVRRAKSSLPLNAPRLQPMPKRYCDPTLFFSGVGYSIFDRTPSRLPGRARLQRPPRLPLQRRQLSASPRQLQIRPPPRRNPLPPRRRHPQLLRRRLRRRNHPQRRRRAQRMMLRRLVFPHELMVPALIAFYRPQRKQPQLSPNPSPQRRLSSLPRRRRNLHLKARLSHPPRR